MKKHYRAGITCTECDCLIPEGEQYYETLIGERVCRECLEDMSVGEFIDFIGEKLTLVQSPEEV